MKLGCAALAALALVASSRDARAQDTKQQCASAYEQAQILRKERKLQKAEEQLAICAQKACPLFVRKECAQWSKDVKANIPTVVFEVRDASGKLLKDARVLINGKVLKDPIDEGEVVIDPGDHVLRYEVPGAEPIEQGVTIREGEKARKLSIQFDTTAPVAPPPPPEAAGSGDGGGPPVLALVLGGVGVVGLGAFVTLGVLGKNQRDDLRDTCAPSCAEADVSSVRTKLLLADVSLGVGVVSLGVATYLFIASSGSKPEPAAPAEAEEARVWFDVAPRTGGGSFSIRGTF
ncbi:MAG TPA: hypothetical protein VE093_18200 [Polyangiaceae bacterium]|jgi:hypothetical protein|nr:hypothetical protein [Polyangiaceae bacterium]